MKKIISILMILAMLCATLATAIPTFAADVNTKDLEDLVEDAEDMEDNQYTEETWDALTASVTAAKAVLNDQYPTQDAIDAAKADLQAKIAALVKVTKEYLREYINNAKAIEKEGFSDESWKALQDAIEEAEEYCTEGGSEREFYKRYAALRDAYKEMQYDTTDLAKLISTANGLVDSSKYAEKTPCAVDGKNAKTYGGDYTEATYATLTAALATAKENVKSNKLDLITASIAELDAAIKGLQPNAVPSELLSRLDDLVDLAEALQKTDWEDTAWRMVETKVKQAQNAPQNAKVSTYVKAVNELETALKLLTNEDKTKNDILPDIPTYKLEYLITWCEDNLTEATYTAETWAELSASLASAKEIAAAPTRVKDVNSAYDKLFAAKEALAIAENAASDNNGGSDDSTVDDTGCGGTIAATAVVMTAVLGLGTAVVLKKKED